MATPSGNGARPFDLPLGLAACVVTWLLLAPFAPIGIDPHHDGIMLKPALDVLHGQVLFRDTFCQYGALAPYLDALALGLFGPTLLVLRLTTVCFYGLSIGVLIVCWRMFLPRSLSLLAFATWLLCVPFLTLFLLLPWSSVPALLFESIACLCLIRALETFRPAPAFLAGTSAGLEFLCRQPAGVFTFAALAACFVATGVRRVHRRASIRGLLASTGGFTLVLAAFAGVLLWTGAFDDWLKQTIVWPRRWLELDWVRASRATLPLLMYASLGVRLFALGTALVLGLRFVGRRLRAPLRWLLAAAYAALVVVVALYVRRSFASMPGTLLLAVLAAFLVVLAHAALDEAPPAPGARAALAALFVCLGSWMQLYPIDEGQHLFWALTPMLGFALWAAWEASGRKTAAVALLTVLLWHPHVPDVLRGAYTKLGGPWVTLAEPPVLAGMRVRPEDARDWTRLGDAVAGYLARRPRVPLMVEGPDALYATLVPNLTNPAPLFVVWPGLDDDGLAARVRFIAENRPLVFAQQNAREPVRQALRAAGYAPLVVIASGELLAPGDASAAGPPAAGSR